MVEIEKSELLKYILEIYEGCRDGYVLLMLPENKGVGIDSCNHNMDGKLIEYYLIQEMTNLMKQRGEPTELGMELIRDIKALKKKDTRFKDNQIYNQAIDDVLEAIK
jgi:hypothetical protein